VSKFIRIGIADKNDNPPYFDKALYEAEVDENEDIQHTVLTVTAKDHDECECILNIVTRVNKFAFEKKISYNCTTSVGAGGLGGGHREISPSLPTHPRPLNRCIYCVYSIIAIMGIG